MSTFGGAPDPYGGGQAGDPYGSSGSPSGAGPPPSGPYGGPGTPPPYGTDPGPYTHSAPGAAPSGPAGAPPGGEQTYLRPGAYGPPGTYGGDNYGGYPPIREYQNAAGGWAVGLGIACLVVCLVPVLSQAVALAAIIAGVIGRKAANEGRANNGGMAMAGIIIGGATLVLSVVLGVAWWGWLGTAIS